MATPTTANNNNNNININSIMNTMVDGGMFYNHHHATTARSGCSGFNNSFLQEQQQEVIEGPSPIIAGEYGGGMLSMQRLNLQKEALTQQLQQLLLLQQQQQQQHQQHYPSPLLWSGSTEEFSMEDIDPNPIRIDTNNVVIQENHHNTNHHDWNQAFEGGDITTITTSKNEPDDTDELNRVFNIENEAVEGDNKEVQRKLNKQNQQWLERLEELKRFKVTHGHCRVPYNYHENPRLAQWIKRQRHQMKRKLEGSHCNLSKEREDLLTNLGFVWNAHQASWDDFFDELCQFKSEYGHCNFPSRYPSNPRLAIWVKTQRRQYKLYQDMLVKQQEQQQEKEQQEQRKSDGTNITTSSSSSSSSNDMSLPINLDRVALLNRLGFVWDPRRPYK